jgi:glyoxylase-like metal-dependent hydrolase (beta-lactamase superfamily II)
MLKIKQFVFSPFFENTYVIWDENSREGAVIDPGCFDSTEQKKLDDFIRTQDLRLKYLINTHCHIDHIFGCRFVKDNYNVIYAAPELDIPLLQNSNTQAEMFGLEIETPPMPDIYINEKEILSIGSSEMKSIFTPGHTPGEYCLYFPAEGFCITGDVLFKESIGRTDLWGGNYDTLIDSIRNKLLILPEETILYPGHGEPTTIAHEKLHNPFL